jgi:hypothetical protein
MRHCLNLVAALPLLLALAGVASAQVEVAKTAASKPAVLLLADAKDDLPTLARRLAAEGYRVERSDQSSIPTELNRFHSLVVYVHQPLVPGVEKALIDYAQGGGRLLVLHHAIASAKMANPRWLAFLDISLAPRDAAEYPWHVSGGVTFTMVNLAPKHFITTRGVAYEKTVAYASPDRTDLKGTFPAFDLPRTEVFHHQRFTDGRDKTILFGYRMDSPPAAGAPPDLPRMEDTAGWYKPTGKGWTFYLQPGHAEHDFENAAFSRIILNCLEWVPEKPRVSIP